jgi:CrcB protein
VRPLVVAGFGALGALARWGLSVATNASARSFPWTTLAVNVAGCFALGLLVAALGDDHPDLRLGVGTGFLGAFTTFSTFSVETTELPAARAALYVALSVGLGLAAAVLGRAVSRTVR